MPELNRSPNARGKSEREAEGIIAWAAAIRAEREQNQPHVPPTYAQSRAQAMVEALDQPPAYNPSANQTNGNGRGPSR